jgi:phosphatidylinositol alpha-mannosyltransferase
LRVLPGADVDVIPNGVDTETFQPDRNERPGSDRFCILYVGRLEPYKGVADLIEALSIVNDPTICLKIAGDGSLNQALRQQTTDLGLNDRVAFLGGIRKQEMPGVYGSADALCLPSIVEGMSNVVLEAMASGLPVVVTDIPGSRDLVQNDRSGLIVPPSEPGKVAEALQKLAGSAETRKRFSAAARIKAGEMSWKKVTEDYIAIYERVLRGSSVATA